jgi:peroxiredoxin Q/BCP
MKMQFFGNIWYIIFIIGLLPLVLLRSSFRKTVYRTTNWKINIQPRFWKEIKGLIGNLYPYDGIYIRYRNLYRMYLIIYLLLLGTFQITANNTNNMKTIQIGDKIPAFELPDQNGELVKSSSFIGNKNAVIFFYPKDDTPGCTKEACYFRDQYDAFVDADAEVIGISGQSVKSHKDFATKHRLSYKILSDKNNKVRKQFGVPASFFGFLPGRVTYVVDKTGTVIHVFNSQTNVLKHVDEALKILEKNTP